MDDVTKLKDNMINMTGLDDKPRCSELGLMGPNHRHLISMKKVEMHLYVAGLNNICF